MRMTSGSHSAVERDSSALFLTPAGREALTARIRQLEALVETLLARQAEGNAEDLTGVEYQRASDEIVRLRAALKAARPVEDLPADPRTVVLGDTVAVSLLEGGTDCYVIVDALEAHFDDRRISSDCPLGRALLGRRVGEVVEVDAPGGRYRCLIESAYR